MNAGASNRSSAAADFSRAPAFLQRMVSACWFAPALLLLFALVAYIPCFGIPPLADEQFLVAWTRNAGARQFPLAEFLQFNGLFAADLWQFLTPLSLKTSFLSSFGLIWLWRIQNVLIHTGAAMVLFYAFSRLGGMTMGLLSAIFFIVWPTNVESVAWLGGRASLLSGFFIATSLACYLKSRDVVNFSCGSWTPQKSWIWLLASLIGFSAAFLSSASVWTLCCIFPLVEVLLWTRTPPDERHDGTFSIIAPLLFLVVTAAAMAATGVFWQLTSAASPSFTFRHVGTTIGAVLIPVNPANYTKVAHHIRFFLCLLVPLSIALVVVSARHRLTFWISIFALVWFVVAVIPFVGFVKASNFAGMHNLYVASMPLCLLLAGAVLSVYELLRRSFPAVFLVAALLSMLLVGFAFMQTWKQIGSLNSGGRNEKSMQKSLKAVRSNVISPLAIIQTVPAKTAVAPEFTENQAAVFDLDTGLLCSNRISGGRLKDSLKIGQFVNAIWRWEPNFGTFIKSDFGSTAATAPVSLNATQLVSLFSPPMEYYKTAHFDRAADEVVLSSQSADAGPVMRLSADWLAPLGPDFFWIDALIDAPRVSSRPVLEFFWQSAAFPEFDFKNRKVTTPVFLSDGSFHRYYLPLRSRGWVTSGQSFAVTIGFPAASKVRIKGIGTTFKDALMPEFSVVGAPGDKVVHFPAFKFPTEPALGLFTMPRGSPAVPITFSCKKLQNAVGVLVEISMPDKDFEIENSSGLSGVTYRTIPLENTEGNFQIPVSDFHETGIYAIRAISIDKAHNIFGNFSDACYVYLPRPKAAWSEHQ